MLKNSFKGVKEIKGVQGGFMVPEKIYYAYTVDHHEIFCVVV